MPFDTGIGQEEARGMINDGCLKKSPNISTFYDGSDLSMAARRAHSHQYLWLGLTCLWNPLKFHQKKPGPFGSQGINTLQYIIRLSSRARWKTEREPFEGGGEGGSAAYLLRENIQVPFFLLEDLASLTHSFPCLRRVSTFLPRSDGYNSRLKPAHTSPSRRWWKHFLAWSGLLEDQFKCLHVCLITLQLSLCQLSLVIPFDSMNPNNSRNSFPLSFLWGSGMPSSVPPESKNNRWIPPVWRYRVSFTICCFKMVWSFGPTSHY